MRHDVLPVHDDGCPGGSAQRGVKNCAVLRDIDLAAGKHRVDAFPQSRLVCELDQKLERFIGDAIFGIVQFDTCGRSGEAFAAGGVVGE